MLFRKDTSHRNDVILVLFLKDFLNQLDSNLFYDFIVGEQNMFDGFGTLVRV